jgi:hypothetical protein
VDDNWGYVAAGFASTLATLLAYGTWLWARLRRARRAGDLDD